MFPSGHATLLLFNLAIANSISDFKISEPSIFLYIVDCSLLSWRGSLLFHRDMAVSQLKEQTLTYNSILTGAS